MDGWTGGWFGGPRIFYSVAALLPRKRSRGLELPLAITILRLGSPRTPSEGVRLGTVRRPPHGVSKSDFTKRDFYDVWVPALSPSQRLVTFALSADDAKTWRVFERKFRTEMLAPESSRLLDLLAALSHQTNFSLGCYCENEERCHRSILRALLSERGAELSEARR